MADLSAQPFRFVVSTAVRKRSGYRFEGWVVAAFHTIAGAQRYVVDNGDGLLMIFNEGQLEPRDAQAQ